MKVKIIKDDETEEIENVTQIKGFKDCIQLSLNESERKSIASEEESRLYYLENIKRYIVNKV